MLAHRSRVGLLRQILLKKTDENFVRECLKIHGRCLEIQEGIKIGNKHLGSSESQKWILAGIAETATESPHKLTRSVLKQIERSFDLVDEECIQSLAKIYAVIGLDKNSPHLPIFRKTVKEPLTLIGLLRRLRSEKELLWKTYVDAISGNKCDPPILTNYMATACASNGWSQRVSSHVFPRRDASVKLPDKTVAHLILAFTHRPMAVPDNTLKELLKLAKLSNPEVFVSVLKLYAINNQWNSVMSMLKHKNRMTIPSGVLESVLSSCQDTETFFCMMELIRDEITNHSMSSLIRKGVDIAFEEKSCRKLLQCLELLVPLDPVTEAKILDLVESGKIPVRVRNRVNALLEMIGKRSTSQFIS